MSHYTVLVVGPEDTSELAEALHPYDEGIQVDPYFDATEPDFGEWPFVLATKDDYTGPMKSDGCLTNTTWLRMFADYLDKRWGTSDDEESWKVVDGKLGQTTTYNPQSKWDWWSVGGRWTGSLLTVAEPEFPEDVALGSPGVFGPPDEISERGADTARLVDIDFEAMSQRALANRLPSYEAFQAAVAEAGGFTPYDREAADAERTSMSIDGWRCKWIEAFWSQPAMVAFKAALGEDRPMFLAPSDMDEYNVPREDFESRVRAEATTPGYAMLVATGDGESQWLAPGRMGWFGSSSDESGDRMAHAENVATILAALPPTTRMFLVDCHI